MPTVGWTMVAVGAWFALTVRRASALVALPDVFETTTLKRAPLSAWTTDGMM